MAKIVRKTQKIFAGSASNNGQFGSAQANTKILSNDPDTIQALGAWLNGWSDAVISGQKLPALEEMQGIQYVSTRQIAYILQEGMAEYDAGTTYYQNSIVKKPGTYELYGSIIDNNIGNALPSAVSNSNWQYLGSLSNMTGVKRELLAANRIYYVATTGSDSNDGLTVGTPFLTIQKAIDTVQQKLDLSGYSVTVQIADGTYNGSIVISGPLTGANNAGFPLSIVGNLSTPANVIINNGSGDAIQVRQGAVVTLAGGYTLTATGNGVIAAALSQVYITGAVIFGACSSTHMYAVDGGHIEDNSAYSITGNSANHMLATQNGSIRNASKTITIATARAFSTAFANATLTGSIQANALSFTGAGVATTTGSRYVAQLNGAINTSGGGANYFPGNVAGSLTSGGQYA